MTFLPDGRVLVTEKSTARLRVIKDGKLQEASIQGLPTNIQTGGQGGLLDVVHHPEFNKNQWIYLSYSGEGEGGVSTEVVRAKLTGNKLTQLKKIFAVEPKMPGHHHFGSRLAFAGDGTLFITVGDRYHGMEDSQNPENHLGTILRVNDDGSIPKDNPFANHDRYKAEIYSYGHRNVQGLAIRPTDGVVWSHEHGPKGGDEVNIMNKPGANYGWPKITYGIDYSGEIISEQTHAEGMEQPIIYWVPSIAPCGMDFYSGDKFPNWKGDLFVGALSGSHIRRLELKGNEVIEQESLIEGFGRIRDVSASPDGFLYFITDESNGKLLRLEPASLPKSAEDK